MDAEFSDKTQARELSATLDAFERATDLEVCLRPMTDRWADLEGASLIRPPHHEHRSPFCAAIKSRSMAACIRCDFGDLPSACSSPSGSRVDPFVRTCHAGADELLLPLWSEGVLAAVLFVGQFKRGDADGNAATAELPRLSADRVRYVGALLRALRSYLGDVLRDLDDQRHEQATGRRGAIEAYVRETLASGPTLAELADRLALSRSRTSHVVREATGHSFQELLEERRIAVAKDLLANTGGTIAWVGEQTGFQNVPYFCRYFKRKTGDTPTGFRRRFRRAVSA